MFDQALAYLERFAAAYPELFALLVVTLGVPLTTGAASFADVWLAKHFPVALAMMRALGFDPKRALAIGASKALESRKLPVPPEVRTLADERVEKAEADSKRPPSPPTIITMMVCLALALTGCADLTWARSVRDASHDAAETAAPLVDRWCVSQQAADLAEVRALPEHSPERERRAEQAQALQRDRRCREVVEAYDTVRVASITLDATVAAAESGQCMAARSASCDVGGAAVKAATATAALATYVQHLQEASR